MSNNFSELKYNLYELMNVNMNSSKNEIESKYRKIIKKFHPDKKKLSELEEEIYYEIIQAHYILTNDKKREKYNKYLTKLNGSFLSNDHEDVSVKVTDKNSAYKKFLSDNILLAKKHGCNEITEKKLQTLLKENKEARTTVFEIDRQNFRGMEDFNDYFIELKNNKNYCYNIEKYNGDILPVEGSCNKLGFVNINDFNEIYCEKKTSNHNSSHLDHAFKLSNNIDIQLNDKIDEKINEYNNLNYERDDFNF